MCLASAGRKRGGLLIVCPPSPVTSGRAADKRMGHNCYLHLLVTRFIPLHPTTRLGLLERCNLVADMERPSTTVCKTPELMRAIICMIIASDLGLSDSPLRSAFGRASTCCFGDTLLIALLSFLLTLLLDFSYISLFLFTLLSCLRIFF